MIWTKSDTISFLHIFSSSYLPENQVQTVNGPIWGWKDKKKTQGYPKKIQYFNTSQVLKEESQVKSWAILD